MGTARTPWALDGRWYTVEVEPCILDKWHNPMGFAEGYEG
jgi:hypothetical protein